MRNRKVIAVLLLGLMLTGCKPTPGVNPSVDNSLTSGDVTTSSDTTTSNDITTSIESSETATLGQVKGVRLVGNNLVWDTKVSFNLGVGSTIWTGDHPIEAITVGKHGKAHSDPLIIMLRKTADDKFVILSQQ